MLYTLPELGTTASVNALLLSQLVTGVPAIHWTVPPELRPFYPVPGQEPMFVLNAPLRSLNLEEERRVFAALLASSELLYEF
jgi:hypothetical protein